METKFGISSMKHEATSNILSLDDGETAIGFIDPTSMEYNEMLGDMEAFAGEEMTPVEYAEWEVLERNNNSAIHVNGAIADTFRRVKTTTNCVSATLAKTIEKKGAKK